ncbi:diacylglycerol/lipid kinase family protein [Streptomyces asiaticus]|uniref:diacylglycerol/lipid kinase family protein n=1 Tax=Streptomyces asiaticus TaxID=114695 RepID=UPI003D71CC88
MAGSQNRLNGRCVVIANPNAGIVSESLVGEVADRCCRLSFVVEVVWAREPGEAQRAARAAVAESDGASLTVIVSVGGDGTAWEVATGMTMAADLSASVALLVVPAGTGNSNFRSHWGESDWRFALDMALGSPGKHLRALDLANIVEEDRLVVLGAGAGLTAQVLQDAGEVPLTGAARLQEGLLRAAVGFTPYPGRVTVDGEVVHEGRTVFANVGGGRHRAWQYDVLPHSVLDDGLLDYCVVGAGTEPRALPELLRTGRHVLRPDTVYGRGRQVVIERLDGAALCFEHDGELLPAGRSRYTLDVLPGRLSVLCAPARHLKAAVVTGDAS